MTDVPPPLRPEPSGPSAHSIAQTFAEGQGWTVATMLGVVLDYVQQLGAPGLDAFLRERGADGPRIIRVLDACASHLPEALFVDLSSWDGVVAYELAAGANTRESYAWLLWVPEDPEQNAADHAPDRDAGPLPDGEEEDQGVPAEVLTLQRFARALGCDYILLDRDAAQVEGLPTWDW